MNKDLVKMVLVSALTVAIIFRVNALEQIVTGAKS